MNTMNEYPGDLEVIHLAVCDSTNSYIKDHLNHLKPRFPVLITARQQLRGRGRQDRTWESAENMGIYSSFGFYLDSPSKLVLLPLAAGIAVIDTLYTLCDRVEAKTTKSPGQNRQGFGLKWPNDVLFDLKKISGILVENVLAGEGEVTCITGIGINLNQQLTDFPPAVREKAISLRMITGKVFDIDEVNRVLSRHFFGRLELVKAGKGQVIIEAATNYSKFLLAKEIVFHHGQEVIRGIFRGIHEDGGLMLEEEGAAGQRKIFYSGEIFF